MAIFSRRTLQRLIDENSHFLSRSQTKTHVDKLNQSDLGTEWEVLLLNLFSKIGKVVHEKDFGGKRPDIFFTPDNPHLEFLADIKTVSDEGIEIKNPRKQLQERLEEEISKRGIKGAWDVQIGGNYKEARERGSMVQLKLPALSRFDNEIFNQKFEEFTSLIKTNPQREHKYNVLNETVELRVTYRPSKEWTGTGGYPSYKSIERREHLIQNSIYNGLVSKSDQLKNTGYSGPLGIILCDGGSEFLLRSRNIIQEFLALHPHINFVLAFRVEQKFGFNSSSQVLIYYEKGTNINAELDEFLSNLHLTLLTFFPYPVKNALNASSSVKSKRPGIIGSFYGGCTMSGDQIKVSSRTILSYLAGNMTYDELPQPFKDFFKKTAAEGKLFDHIEIEKSPDERDDDWLIIKFGAPDPAVTHFITPN